MDNPVTTAAADAARQQQRRGLTLGLGTIVTDGYGGKNPEGFPALLRAAAAAGITDVDTAAVYGHGESERLLGRWMRELGLSFSICTKVGMVQEEGAGARVVRSATPESLLRQAEASLERLQVDRVDRLLLHHPDPQVPVRASIEGLIACREAGLAAKIGFSNLDDGIAAELVKAGMVDVIQYPWSLLDSRRDAILRLAGEQGVERMVFGTLAFGILAGSVRRDTVFEADDWRGIARSGRDPGTTGAALFLGDTFGRAVDHAARFAALQGCAVADLAALTVAASLEVAPAERVMVGCRSAEELAGLAEGRALTPDPAALAFAREMAVA
ncbi:aldo/keto reductase [Celeribacter indicus]|uniref:Aldo/keto reductase n=1 Tax=Celeribacter indicus TaxID=1208324 RepID=A0A0B5DTK7_9RHOB|nr:aldo/keto reductase [Celeribacter indicus]AJE46768.1 aldo/keto reductase [Celeribacter indicus]SDX05969.1 Predicted oxidoreductase [Celeribacter indicus]